MKNTFISAIILSSIIFSPLTTFADTTQQISREQLVLSLMEQIKVLQEKVLALEESQKETKSKIRQDKKSKARQPSPSKSSEEVTVLKNKIYDYLIKLDSQISETKQKIAIAEALAKSTPSKVTKSVCAGTKTSNGCLLGDKRPSSNVSNMVNGNILAQLSQRKEDTGKILVKLDEKGMKSMTENDKAFLTSVGIKW